MSNFKFIDTTIKGLYIIEPKVFLDDRGYFFESFNQKYFEQINLNLDFVQDNESMSKKGVLRGMHFQTKYPQGKLVRVTQGEVYDVAVDMRKDSPTYKHWMGIILSDSNKKQFYIPPGFAHGFLVLSDIAVFNYKCTNYYMPEYDCGFVWNDEDIGISWPLNKVDEIILSEKDKKLRLFKEVEEMELLI